MNELECKNCHTKSASKYCPNCGKLLFAPRVRSVAEIDYMEDLCMKAVSMKEKDAKSPMLDIMLTIVTSMVFSWVKGGDLTPVELIITKKEKELTEEGRTLIELAKLGPSKKE